MAKFLVDLSTTASGSIIVEADTAEQAVTAATEWLENNDVRTLSFQVSKDVPEIDGVDAWPHEDAVPDVVAAAPATV